MKDGGHVTMGKRSEGVTEVLDYVPGRFRIVRHIPSLPNSAAMPSLSVSASASHPRGRAGAGLLAHVIVSKFANLPLYRQSEIYASEGVELSRSTLADLLGQVSWLLAPLIY